MDYTVGKRLFDLVVSAGACVLLFPLFVIIALAIMLDSPGSPIFTQERIGLNCRSFNIFKFRSMVKDAPLLGLWWTSKDDPRITRVGKILRATSLDELPQLLNVIIGDMSLVGPRPEAPVRESIYKPEDWQLRHRVRPGITGLAQVNGRSSISNEEQIGYDMRYVANPTFVGDVEIILKTALVVFGKRDAN